MMVSILPLVGPDPKTPEWYQARMSCIGASEAAAACGLSPYAQPLDLYLEKRGMKPPKEETDAMRLGTLMEPVVISEYEHRTGYATKPCSLLFHGTNRFIGATPDRMVLDQAGRFPMDAKTTTFRRAAEFGEEGSDQIPTDYLLQAQQQMYVTSAERCDIAVLLDGRTLRVYQVARHDDLIEMLVQAETELWQRIVDGNPPEPNWTHPRTPELVRSLHGLQNDLVVELSEETSESWRRYQSLGDRIKILQEERDALKARVLYAMGEAATGRLADGAGELTRKMVTRKAYTVKETSYLDLRERKIKG